MSAPDYSRLGTAHRTIKKETDKLADWLVNTARRLKDDGIDGLSSGGNAQACSHRLSINTLGRLTDFVVEAVPKIEVPYTVVITARKIYQARQERTIIFQGPDPESDDGHQHVVVVMKSIHRKLKDHFQASQDGRDANAEAKTASTSEERGSTIPSFRSLKIEQPDCGDEDRDTTEGGSGDDARFVVLQTSQKQGRKKKATKKKKILAKAQKQIYHLEEDEDPYFVLMCLLSDLNSMRHYIKDIWQEYKDGKVDLVTVSLTTTATFDIIRTYEDDFPAISSLLSDYSLTMKMVLSRNLEASDEGLNLFFNPCWELAKVDLADLVTVGETLSKVSTLADLTFATAFYFLNGPRNLVVQKSGHRLETIDIKLNPFIDEQSRLVDSTKLSAVRRLQEDVRVLATFAQFVQYFDQYGGAEHDLISQLWVESFEKTDHRTISLALTFGFQLYLDIHSVLGQDVERGYRDLYKSNIDVVASIVALNRCPLQDQGVTDLLYGVLKEAQSVLLLEQIHDEQVTKYGKVMHGTEADDLIGLSSFFKSHPLLCGIISSHIVQMHRSSALLLAERYGTIKSAGQFYYSCQRHRRQYKSGKDIVGRQMIPSFADRWIWDDMDFVMQVYGQDAFFEGRLPESNEDFITSLSPMMESALIKRGWKIDPHRLQGHMGPINARPGHKDESIDKIKYARDLSSYECIAVTHRLFFSKHNGEQGEWTIETLQALLEDHLAKYKGRGNLKKRKLKGKGSKALARTTIRDKDGDISQIAILETLKETLQRESRALRFDFLAFHVRCFELLCRLRDENRYLVESIPDRLYYNDADISKACAMLQVKINVPEPRSDILCMYSAPHSSDSGSNLGSSQQSSGQVKVTITTKKGHVAIDSSLRCYLDENGCKDGGVKKLDSIWGIATS